jgi:hypothetical protein
MWPTQPTLGYVNYLGVAQGLFKLPKGCLGYQGIT